MFNKTQRRIHFTERDCLIFTNSCWFTSRSFFKISWDRVPFHSGNKENAPITEILISPIIGKPSVKNQI